MTTIVIPARRRWARRVAITVAWVLVLLPASSPLWFPWMLGAVARGLGVDLGGSRRVGWTRVQLHAVETTVAGARIRAREIELPQLLVWLGRLAGRRAETPMIRVNGWSVDVDPAERSTAPAPDPGPGSVADALAVIGPILDRFRWVPGPIELREGSVHAGVAAVTIADAWLEPDRVRLAVAGEAWQGTAEVRPTGTAGFEINGALAPWGLTVEGRAEQAGTDWQMTATIRESSTNRADLSARFVPGRPRPVTATIRGTHLRVPLPETLPGILHVDLNGSWTNDSGGVAVRLTGETRLPSSTNPVPITGDVEFQVSPERLRLETLRVASSPVRVRLSEAITLSWSDRTRIPPATLEVAVQLDAISGGRLQGRVEGTVVSAASEANEPEARFVLAGTGLGVAGRHLGEAEIEGNLATGVLRVTRGVARLPGDTTLRVQADVDLRSAEVRRAEWAFDGIPPLVAGPVPASIPTVSGDGTAQGPFTNLVHQGKLRTLSALAWPGWQPLNAQLAWQGRGLEFEALELTGGPTNQSARFHLRTRGGFEPASRTLRFRLETLALTRATESILTLKAPVPVLLRFPTGDPGSGVTMAGELGPLRWVGPGGDWTLAAESQWPDRARVALEIANGRIDWVADWLAADASRWMGIQIERLGLEGHWDGGPLEARFAFQLAGSAGDLGRLRADGSGGMGGSGIRLERLQVERREGDAVTLSGSVPWFIRPGGNPWGGWLEPGPELQGELRVPATAWIWEWLAQHTGVRPTAPLLRVALSGTAAAPEARVDLDTGPTSLPPLRAADGVDLPPLESSSLRARLTRAGLILEDFRVSVNGQEARLQGRLPWPNRPDGRALPDWAALDWREAEARLSIPQADLSPFLARVSELVHPSGTLRAEVELESGALQGWLEASGLALQPSGPVGTLRDLGLRLALREDRVELERGEASLGGQPLSLSGWLAVPQAAWGNASAELRVQATNVAVVRSPQALLRADLDVALGWTNGGAPPQLGGLVTLRDSVVMQDLRDFVGVDLEHPERRPPYFSVSQPPLADWGLDLRVRGPQFARVLSPVFRGTVSADLRLVGTLRSPRVLGEGLVDRGQILFPFGQLQLNQARVRFSDANPYRPSLEGRAEGMNFGYTVALELGGTLDRPLVRFDSVPPMSTREVLQMLTAGSLPNREYTYSATAKMQNVGAYLAGDLLSTLTGDPSEESRLTLRSGQRVSTSGRLTYGVEYRLSDRWSLVGEYDRWSQFNAGVRWRVLEK